MSVTTLLVGAGIATLVVYLVTLVLRAIFHGGQGSSLPSTPARCDGSPHLCCIEAAAGDDEETGDSQSAA